MKTSSLISSLAFIMAFTARFVLSYWMGYYEKSLMPLTLTLPLECAKLVAVFILFITWIIALIRKKQRMLITILLIFTMILRWSNVRILNPNGMIVYGLKKRLLNDYSLDDLRSFAQEFDRVVDEEHTFLGHKTFMKKDLTKIPFSRNYPFLAWVDSPSSKGPSYVSESNQIVHVKWGSALSGHWGFSIGVNRVNNNVAVEPDGKIIRLSDDIVLLYEPD